MPIYEYDCGACKNKFELLVFSSDEKPACPACKSTNVSRAFSPFAAHSKSSAQKACPSAASCPADQNDCSSGYCPYSQ